MTVLIVILAALFIILLLPIGVVGGYDFGDVELKVIAGPVKIQVYPKKTRKNKPEKPALQKKQKKKAKAKTKKPKPVMTLEIITEYVRLGTRALGRLRRKLSINRLQFYYLSAGEDPFGAAVSYGIANAAVANILSMLHCAFNIKEQDVRIRVDFLEPQPKFSFGADMTIRIWEVLYIGVCALIAFLKILKKQKYLKKLTNEGTDGNGETSNSRHDGNHDVKDKGNG